MRQKPPFFLFLLLCFSLNTFLNAQTENDSLAKYSYEELRTLRKNYRNSNNELSKIYIDEYLSRSINDNDTVRMYYGYFFLSKYYENKEKRYEAIRFLDSVIKYSLNKQDKYFPALSYFNKSSLFYEKGKNEQALKYLFKALDLLKINKNILLEIETRSAIITIKNNWSSNEETLNFAKENLEFIIKNKYSILNYTSSYFIALKNLSRQYLRNKKYLKCKELTRKGIEESLDVKDTVLYYDFVSLSGTALYYLKNYQEAIDSLQKALLHKNDHGKAMSNYYLGKSYDKLNQPEKAHFHFLKTDSIYQVTKDIFPEMRNVYEHIIDYYKSKNDVENQIKYYDRLLETDKIIDSTYTYIKETIEKKFDTPQAISERARLLEEAQAKENSWKYRFGAISGILLIILGILIAAFRRQKYYKKRFQNLMNVEPPQNTPKKSAEAFEARKTQTKEIDVPQEIVDNILSQLQKFEASQKFTKQISLTDLAKKLKTNPKYLSKVINGHYEKNFSSYMNELRIEYVISRLKGDSKFRNYTIKAIGKEAGFGNTESFSKAFHKITGIKPSYFINQLQKRLEG